MVRGIGGKLAERGMLPAADPAAPPSVTTPLGAAEDIAWAVVYLASDESRFVSGQKLVVDNCLTATPAVVPHRASAA